MPRDFSADFPDSSDDATAPLPPVRATPPSAARGGREQAGRAAPRRPAGQRAPRSDDARSRERRQQRERSPTPPSERLPARSRPEDHAATPDPPRRRPRRQEQDHGHGHGHGHGPMAPVSRRVRTLLIAALAPLALATVVGVVLLYPWGENDEVANHSVGVPVDGTVTAVTTGPCLAPGQVHVGEPAPDQRQCLDVEVRLTEGAAEGETITKPMPLEPSTPRFAVGDEVVLSYSGADARDPASYQVRDFQRGGALLVLAALFAGAVLLLGRRQGLASLAALGLSFATLVLFVLPAILAGEDPLLVAIAGAGLIMFVALYLTHGLSARTSVAVLGTMISLALIGTLSAIFSSVAALTGLDGDTTTLIASLGHGIDARGLLLAGVVIGALGVLDDVTVTQASAVWELRRANPALGWRELYTSALRIGRDHVGSAVNTLVLAYAGAALPLLLLASLSDVGLGSVLESQDIAQEIVRTLAGSIGIIAAVPVTTLLATLIAVRDDAAAPTDTDHIVDTGTAEDTAGTSAERDRETRPRRRVSPPGSRRTG